MRNTFKLVLLALAVSSNALAADKKADNDFVVATVNGQKIMLSEIESMHKANPQLGALPLQNLYEPLVDNAIDMTIISDAGRKEKIQNTPEFKKMMADVEKQMIARMYLEQQAKKMQTKEKLLELYNQYKRENPPQEEMKASHILVKSEKEANDIINQLNKGADFSELAAKVSEDKATGGNELDYFTRELMVPEFSEAAFRMKEGEISKVPVKTQYGYHVIKAGARRLAEVPPFEDVEKELMQAQASKSVQEIVKKLRDKAKIVKTEVKFDAAGNVIQ